MLIKRINRVPIVYLSLGATCPICCVNRR